MIKKEGIEIYQALFYTRIGYFRKLPFLEPSCISLSTPYAVLFFIKKSQIAKSSSSSMSQASSAGISYISGFGPMR